MSNRLAWANTLTTLSPNVSPESPMKRRDGCRWGWAFARRHAGGYFLRHRAKRPWSCVVGSAALFCASVEPVSNELLSVFTQIPPETKIVPGSLLSQVSALASPDTFVWARLKAAALSLFDPPALEINARIERWLLDEVPLPGMARRRDRPIPLSRRSFLSRRPADRGPNSWAIDRSDPHTFNRQLG